MLIWKAAVLLLLAGSIAPVPGDRDPARATASQQSSLQEARERWLSATPARRRELWRRYEVYRSMSPARRERILRRNERLRAIAREVASEPGQEERLGVLPPRRRPGALHGLVRERLEHQARVIARILSKERRAELERIPAGRRGAVLRQWVRQELERREQRFLEERGPQGAERTLPERPRRRRVLDLRRQALLQEMRQDRRWDLLTPRVRRWIETLEPEAFFESFPAIQRHWRAVGGSDLRPRSPRPLEGRRRQTPERRR
ncbi:MAG: DUF3106 domain-containing protein [Planctomycetes bacterium]|nr:DUF3106 domain-containing protein [Planctomycetota bacterium]